jgi:hypothetical protein
VATGGSQERWSNGGVFLSLSSFQSDGRAAAAAAAGRTSGAALWRTGGRPAAGSEDLLLANRRKTQKKKKKKKKITVKIPLARRQSLGKFMYPSLIVPYPI